MVAEFWDMEPTPNSKEKKPPTDYQVSFRAAVTVEFDEVVNYSDFFSPNEEYEEPTDDRIREYISRYVREADTLSERAWMVLNLMDEWALLDDETVEQVDLKWEIK